MQVSLVSATEKEKSLLFLFVSFVCVWCVIVYSDVETFFPSHDNRRNSEVLNCNKNVMCTSFWSLETRRPKKQKKNKKQYKIFAH